MTKGVIWRWLRAKGLAYAQEYQDYNIDVEDAVARNAGKQVLSLNNDQARVFDPANSLNIPDGSWSL
jgi:hypothetical protein